MPEDQKDPIIKTSINGDGDAVPSEGQIDIKELKSGQVKVEVELTSNVAATPASPNSQSNLGSQGPIGNQQNNRTTPPPKAIIQPPIDTNIEIKPPAPIYAGGDSDTAGIPTFGPNPDIVQQGTLQVTPQVTSQQGTISTAGNYQPDSSSGPSASNQPPKSQSRTATATATGTTTDPKYTERLSTDQKAITEQVFYLVTSRPIGAEVKAKEVLERCRLSGENLAIIIKDAHVPNNYENILTLWAEDEIRRIKGEVSARTPQQAPTKSTIANPVPNTPPQAANGFQPGLQANNFQPQAKVPAPEYKNPGSVAPSNLGAIMAAAPAQGQLDTSETDKTPRSDGTGNQSQTPEPPQQKTPSPAGEGRGEGQTIPQAGKLNPNVPATTAQPDPEDDPNRPKDGTIGNASLGGLGVGEGNNNFAQPAKSTSRMLANDYDPDRPDDQMQSPYTYVTDPNTGQRTRLPLPESMRPEVDPSYNGPAKDNSFVDIDDAIPERREEVLNAAKEQADNAQRENEATNNFTTQEDINKDNINRAREVADTVQASNANPAQKSKLQQAAEGKIKGMIAKALAPVLGWIGATILLAVLFMAVFIGIFQPIADAFYCKNGAFRAIADVALTIGSSMSPVVAIFKNIFPHIAQCEKDSKNSANSNCVPDGTSSGSNVPLSGCLKTLIEGKNDNDNIYLWLPEDIKTNKGKPDYPVKVGKFKEIISAAEIIPDAQERRETIALVLAVGPVESGYNWEANNGVINGEVYDCKGIAQLCPGYNGTYSYEQWTLEALGIIPTNQQFQSSGLTTPKQGKLTAPQAQMLSINEGRKRKLESGILPGKPTMYRVAAQWLGYSESKTCGGKDANQTCADDYGEAALRNDKLLFSCGTTASLPPSNTYAQLTSQLEEQQAKQTQTVSKDWKWINPLGGVDGLAQASGNLTLDDGTVITVEHLKFLDLVATTKGYTKFKDAGKANAEMITQIKKMEVDSRGMVKVLGGQSDGYGYRSPVDSANIFFGKISKESRWTPEIGTKGISEALNKLKDEQLEKIKQVYLERANSVAPPYFSEHTAGGAVDFDLDGAGTLVDTPSLRDSSAYKWLIANGSKYGFEESYPAGTSVGAGPEPWHWRHKPTIEAAKITSTNSDGTSTASTANLPKCPAGFKPSPGSSFNFDNLTNSGTSNPGGFIWPSDDFSINSRYGWRSLGWHGGIDIGGTLGVTKIFASADGTVSDAESGCPAIGYYGSPCGGGYGNLIYIDHPGGYQTRYAHNNSIYVRTGQSVKQGDLIALLGTSGSSTGPHGHFEIRLNNQTLDPCSKIKCP